MAVGIDRNKELKQYKRDNSIIFDENSQKPTEKIFADADILLAPIRIGGGSQYKILEERMQLLFMRVWNLKMDFKKISFKNIPREENNRADWLVNQTLDAAETQHLL